MKILMILISYDFPTDIRVEKEARALLAAGHQVTLVCENRKQRPAREQWKGIDIIRLPPQYVWWRQLNTGLLFFTFRSPVWERQIDRIVAEEKPDAIHVHDLPFVGPGLRIARRHHVPLVADLHENFPDHCRTRQPTLSNPVERGMFDPERFDRYERQVTPQCDRVIVVVQEAIARLEEVGVARERIFVVGNAEDVTAVPEHLEPVTLPEGALKLMYVGGLQSNRGLDTAIRAMPKIIKQIPSALLVIVGGGVYQSALEQLTRELGLTDVVTFKGQQPFEKVHSYINAGDICLVPHTESPEINTTMPHKLFQYMYLKKPVIVSSAKPLARVVNDAHCGKVFESANPDAFANCVIALQDPAVRQQLGENGHRAVLDRYSWQQESKELVKLYATLTPEPA